MLPAAYVIIFFKKLNNNIKYLQVINDKKKAYRVEHFSFRLLPKTLENKVVIEVTS